MINENRNIASKKLYGLVPGLLLQLSKSPLGRKNGNPCIRKRNHFPKELQWLLCGEWIESCQDGDGENCQEDHCSVQSSLH